MFCSSTSVSSLKFARNAHAADDAHERQEPQQQQAQHHSQLPQHAQQLKVLGSAQAKPSPTKAELIGTAGAITPLVKLLEGSCGDEAQEQAAGALWALADHANNRVTINEAGGIDPLVKLLGSPNGRSRAHADLALVRLSLDGTTRPLICEKLTSMLADERGTAEQEQAAAALANLARESSENRESILKADGVPRLLRMLQSESREAREKSASAVARLAYKSRENQNAVARAGGIPMLVSTLTHAASSMKDNIELCTLIASCIWHVADGNHDNQTSLMKEGAIPPIVGVLTNPNPPLQTNAAGALCCLSRDHPENQAALAKAGAIPPLCTMVRDGTNETKEESAAALWALAADNVSNKSLIAKLGGIEPLVNLLVNGVSDRSSMNAANALAALAAQHAENRLNVIKRMVAVLAVKSPSPRAVRLLSAVATLCDNEPTNQVAMIRSGGLPHLIMWLQHGDKEVQTQAARAMLTVASSNHTTQASIGSNGGIPPLIALVRDGVLQAQEHAVSALWHLATLRKNHVLMKKGGDGIRHVVGLLSASGEMAPQLASMLLLRLAEASSRAAGAITNAGGVAPLVRLLSEGTAATQQMSAAILAAIGRTARNRDLIINSGAAKPLITLIWSVTLGTPETAARALFRLAQNEHIEDDDVSDIEVDVEPSTASSNVGGSAKGAGQLNTSTMLHGGNARRQCIKDLDGVSALIKMLDGTNLPGSRTLKPGAVGGWETLQIGVAGAIELPQIFPGSLVDFGKRVGMQEQAAATLAALAYEDLELQRAIIDGNGLPPLLSLVQAGSPVAAENAARCLWHIAMSDVNQATIMQHHAITDLVTLVKTGSPAAQEMAAAALAALAQGYLSKYGAPSSHQKTRAKFRGIVDAAMVDHHSSSLDEEEDASTAAYKAPPIDSSSAEIGHPGHFQDEHMLSESATASMQEEQGEALSFLKGDAIESNRLKVIADAGAIPPLVKLMELGTLGGKEKAAAALRHLALDDNNQVAIAGNGGIKPLVGALADGTVAAQEHALHAIKALAEDNPDNQAQTAKRLIALLEHDDVKVASRGVRALERLAIEHAGAPVVIVNNGAISPLVGVLSNGKTDDARNEAAHLLHTLANSGNENQLAIAIGLVQLLGVGSNHAQEYVTSLLLDLSSGLESDFDNRQAIAEAGPFKMLVRQLHSDSAKVRRLAAAVMSRLSGDSKDNVAAIADAHGIPPLVKLLESSDVETQAHAAVVLADMTLVSREHADAVARGGGVPLLVALLASAGSVNAKAVAASALGSIAVVHTQAVGESGAIAPLIELLQSSSQVAQKQAAYALAGISASCLANQERVEEAGGIPLLVQLLASAPDRYEKKGAEAARWEVLANVAGALGELGSSNPENQAAVAACNGIEPIISLLTTSSREEPKEQAAFALWRLSSKCHANQIGIAGVGGISSLVHLLGMGTEKGQQMAAEALASLALDNDQNQVEISVLLIQLLANSSDGFRREKAARGISRFCRAHPSNQDAIAAAGGVELVVSLLSPQHWEYEGLLQSGSASVSRDDVSGALQRQGTLPNLTRRRSSVFKIGKGGNDDTPVDPTSGDHHLIQRELASALWSMSDSNAANQERIAHAAGIPLIVKLLGDHADIHRDAAGALWSLAADANNRCLIANEGGIRRLVETLRTGKKNAAQETAAGALSVLAKRGENRVLIADSGGIASLIQLYEGGSEMAKIQVTGALLALCKDTPHNQYMTMAKLVAVLQAGPVDTDVAPSAMRIEVEEQATNVICLLTRDRDVKDAISRTGIIAQLTKELRAGSSAKARHLAAEALVQIARMSSALHIQASAQLVTLLGNVNEDVRQRAGNALRDMNEGDSSSKSQKDVAIANGVTPLVELLKDGLANNRVEAQEYALWSLAIVSDARRGTAMVRAGIIAPLIRCLTSGKIGIGAQEYAAIVASCLALDKNCHDEYVANGGVTPLVQLLATGTVGTQRNAALSLARLAIGSIEMQTRVASEGAIKPFTQWLISYVGDGALVEASLAVEAEPVERCEGTAVMLPSVPSVPSTLHSDSAPRDLAEVAALALADLARNNEEHQTIIAHEGAIQPLIAMISDFADAEIQNVACSALATLAQDHHKNQIAIATLGGIAPLVNLTKSNRPRSFEDASRALSLLAAHDAYKTQLTGAGGIEPLVSLLRTDNQATQQYSAVALEGLCFDSSENQVALANCKAVDPLVMMLACESGGTAESAVSLLLCLAEHPLIQKSVIKNLVDTLVDRNVSAQLKATEALAALSSRNSAHRVAIVKAGAIEPLVLLLGNGQRAENGTPPERAAAVLADVARLAESKDEIAKCNGIAPLAAILSSASENSTTHAACAMFHLSTTAANKANISKVGGIPLLVDLLGRGKSDAQRYAAGALWQLCQSVDNKMSIVGAGGIEALVGILHTSEAGGVTPPTRTSSSPSSSLTARRSAKLVVSDGVVATPLMMAKEAAAAVLAELARSQSSYRMAIVNAKGIAPLLELLRSDVPGAQKQAACAIWGLTCEVKCREAIASVEGTTESVIELLRSSEDETRGFAAATLVALASDAVAREKIKRSGASTVLMNLANGPESWLRSQCVQVLNLIGTVDPPSKVKAGVVTPATPNDSKETIDMLELLGYSDVSALRREATHIELRYQSNPKPMLARYSNPYAGYMPTSPRSPQRLDASGASTVVRLSSHAGTSAALLAQFQAKLAQNPTMWMMQEKLSAAVTEDHMEDLAVRFKVQDQVIVLANDTFNAPRKARIAYVGKVPEIAPGFWLGVQFEDPHGKNDGSLNGTRYFKCKADHGGFLRPNRIEADPEALPDAALLARDSEPSAPFERQESLSSHSPASAQDTGQLDPDMGVAGASNGKSKKPKLQLRSEKEALKEKGRAPTARMGTDDKTARKSSTSQRSGPSARDAAMTGSPIASAAVYERTQMRQAVEIASPAKKKSPVKMKKGQSPRE